MSSKLEYYPQSCCMLLGGPWWSSTICVWCLFQLILYLTSTAAYVRWSFCFGWTIPSILLMFLFFLENWLNSHGYGCSCRNFCCQITLREWSVAARKGPSYLIQGLVMLTSKLEVWSVFTHHGNFYEDSK